MDASGTKSWRVGTHLDRETLIGMSKPCAVHWTLVALREWTTILALMWVCTTWPHPLLWIVGIVLIGARQHALGVLVHDAAHRTVHSSRRWNDRVANYLAAYPLYFPVQGYRVNHLEHHRLLETPRDPERLTVAAFPEDFTFPMPRSRLIRILLRDVVGASVIPFSKLAKYVWVAPGGNGMHLRRIVALHAVVIGLASTTGHLLTYLVFWVVPVLTTFALFFRLRTAAEHSGLGPPEERYTREFVDPTATTRTMIPGPIARALVAPYNISYHTEHHLYPSVPGFRLRKLRRLLLAHEDYAKRVHVTNGFRELFGELTSVGRPAGPAEAKVANSA